MNVVIYTNDMEPITVVDLPKWLLDKAEQEGRVRVAVQAPLGLKSSTEPINLKEYPDLKTVVLHCERMEWRGQVKTVLVTDDEVLALQLSPKWLPGQQATYNGYRQHVNVLTQQLYKALKKP